VSQFYLYDDATARAFEPFALTRPVGELRAGALLIRQRWERALGMSCAGFIGAPHLADFEEFDAPCAITEGELPAGAIVVNARAVPSLQPFDGGDRLELDGAVASVRLANAVPVSQLADGTCPLDALARDDRPATALHGHWLSAPWDLIRHLAALLAEDIVALGAALETTTPPGATLLGSHPLFVESGATIEPMVVFDLTAGPILVARGASVAAFTRLVGPCAVASHAQVLGGKVGTTSIGEHCRVHGEVSTTIFVGHANKGHDGFVGHSVLGRWVNLGAATVTSNLKNTYGAVQLWTPDGARNTGLQFLGTMFGDHAKTAIGTRLTTGSVVGAGANVVGSGLTAKVVPPFLWGEGSAVYDLMRFIAVAERVMARRGVSLGERGRRHLERAYAARWSAAT
jgi:UDP-N-acetylglucosamine diphosphorylase / glucose-1-phosphate thymidylyltransferase / UDP-N-acetylgalactosamine diphosphorylase / glucosamine-1-phosphate N-acetyltransferase / galactosamine-1-phosphate N-acetyltransferase